MDPPPNSPGARIRDRLQQLEDALKELLEIDPASSPGTLKKREDLVQEILHRMSQMSAMNILSRRQPTPIPASPPGHPISPTVSTPPPPVDPVVARCQSLLPKFNAEQFPPLTAQNFRHRLTTPNNGNYAVSENDAFEMLFCGYVDTTLNWRHATNGTLFVRELRECVPLTQRLSV
ncbi:hypothetical protein ARMGADRAFT_273894 [Armillaria gallica]|uniref:Uncharacterized protein n=1 Tax=Armillaria gallica TaxID=47427 RepID=A0A2H3E9L5_ARMGA|nr:hypothetical protein ARMGADRAFT_273894 [Armillaria gallica]